MWLMCLSSFWNEWCKRKQRVTSNLIDYYSKISCVHSKYIIQSFSSQILGHNYCTIENWSQCRWWTRERLVLNQHQKHTEKPFCHEMKRFMNNNWMMIYHFLFCHCHLIIQCDGLLFLFNFFFSISYGFQAFRKELLCMYVYICSLKCGWLALLYI